MADLDVATLTEVKGRLGGSVTRVTDDQDIQADITALSALFDGEFGAVVQRQVANEEISVFARPGHLPLKRWPLLSDPAPAVDDGTVEVLSREFGILCVTSTEMPTSVTYTAGRFADTSAVDELFKAAFIVTLRNWRQADHAAPFVPAGPDYPTPRTSFPTFALPRASAAALHDYRRPGGSA